MGLLPPVIAELQANITDFSAKMAEAKGEMDGVADHSSTTSSKLSSIGGALVAGIAGAAVAVGAVSVKMAGDFQSSMTQLVTGAGEAQSNIGEVSKGILAMASTVGQTPQELASGMYLIESAGYHGAAGLDVLKASAEGAAVGGAQMSTVAGAVTTALTDYHLPASQAADVTSALVETVASGKTHLEDLGSALGKVMPTAAALGINFQTVTGAMSTMTNAGLTARFAATHLQNTLLALSAPSAKAASTMATVGLSAQGVKNEMDGPQGLSGALTMITDAVGSKFPEGSVGYVTAMKDILGGTTGYSTALMLGGKNAKEFSSDVSNIGKSLDRGSNQVQGFSKVQGDLNFQFKQLEAGAEAVGIEIGEWLIPRLEDLAKDVMNATEWLGKHKDVLYAIGAVVLPLVGAAITAYAITKVQNLVSTLSGAYNTLDTFANKLLNIGTQAETAAGDMDAATADMTGDLATINGDAATTSAALAGIGGETALEGAGGAGALSVDGTAAAADIEAATAAGGLTAAGDIEAAEISGGLTAAGELSGAEITGGLEAGGELSAGEISGAVRAGAELGAGEAAGGTEAGVEVGAAEAAGGVTAGGTIGAAEATGLRGLAGIAVPIAGLVAAVGTLGNILKPGGLVGEAEHTPSKADITHPSQWIPDIASAAGAGIAQGFQMLHLPAGGLDSTLKSTQPAWNPTANQQLLTQVQKAPTVEAKLDVVNSAISKNESALTQLQATQKMLASEKTVSGQAGTLKNSEATLTQLKQTAATDKSLNLGNAINKQNNQAITATKEHIDQLKTVAQQITKSKDTVEAASKMQSELDKVNSSTKDTTSGVKDVNSSIKDNTSSTKDVNSSIKDVNSSVKDTKSSVDDVKSSVKDTTSSVKDVKSSVDDVKSNTKDVTSALQAGIPITKLPSQTMSLSGSATLSVT